MAKKKVKAAGSAPPATTEHLPVRPTVTATKLPPAPFPKVHYLSLVPLQLLGVLFSCLNAAQSTRSPSSPSISSPGLLLDALIDRPIPFLGLALAGIAIVQVYAGITLRSLRRKSYGAEKEDGTTKAKSGTLDELKKPGGASKVQLVSAIKGINFDFLVEAATITLLATGVFHCFAIALGAPFFTNLTKTLLASALVALLAITPIAITIPRTEQHVWLRLLGNPATELESALMYPALGAIVGCWAGALPLPLDWGRPWQAWPTTSVVGALGGHAVGSVTSLVLCAMN